MKDSISIQEKSNSTTLNTAVILITKDCIMDMP